jgi:hypothetical protein
MAKRSLLSRCPSYFKMSQISQQQFIQIQLAQKWIRSTPWTKALFKSQRSPRWSKTRLLLYNSNVHHYRIHSISLSGGFWTRSLQCTFSHNFHISTLIPILLSTYRCLSGLFSFTLFDQNLQAFLPFRACYIPRSLNSSCLRCCTRQNKIEIKADMHINKINS